MGALATVCPTCGSHAVGAASLPPPALEPQTASMRARLKERLPDAFDLWLWPLELVEVVFHESGDDIAYVRAPALATSWVRERYIHPITSAVASAVGRKVAVEIVGPEWRPRVPQSAPAVAESPPGPQTAPTPPEALAAAQRPADGVRRRRRSDAPQPKGSP